MKDARWGVFVFLFVTSQRDWLLDTCGARCLFPQVRRGGFSPADLTPPHCPFLPPFQRAPSVYERQPGLLATIQRSELVVALLSSSPNFFLLVFPGLHMPSRSATSVTGRMLCHAPALLKPLDPDFPRLF